MRDFITDETHQSHKDQLQDEKHGWRNVVHCSDYLIPRFVPKQEKDYHLQRKKEAISIVKYLAVVVVLLNTIFVFLGGWETSAQRFLRIQNVISASGYCFAYIVLTRCKSLIKYFDEVVLLWCTHYLWYQSLAYYRMCALFGTSQNDDWCATYDLIGEAYIVMWLIVCLLAAVSLRVLSLHHSLCLCVLAPFQWLAQIFLLGSALEMIAISKILVIFSFISGMTWVSARVIDVQARYRYLDIFRLTSERSEIRRMMRHASVPVAIVSCGGSSDHSGTASAGSSSPAERQRPLLVDLWNDTLVELTNEAVPEKFPLKDIVSLKGSHLTKLESMVRKALDRTKRGTTRNLLMPLIATRGTVWLQVDVWPVSSDADDTEPQAVIIGTDVTDFVSRHESFLHVEGAGHPGPTMTRPNRNPDQIRSAESLDSISEQKSHTFDKSGQESLGSMSATVSVPGFTLSSCSAHFNVFFGRRMDEQSLLKYIDSPQDKQDVQDLVVRAAQGQGPLEISVKVVRRYLTKLGAQSNSKAGEKSHLQFPLVWLQFRTQASQASVSLLIDYVEREVDDSRSLVNGAWSDSQSVGDDTRYFNRVPARSDPGCGKSDFKTSVSGLFPSANDILLNALALHVVELAGHFPFSLRDDAIRFIQEALEHVLEDPLFSSAPYIKCTLWKCAQCTSANDLDDTCCFVCGAEEEHGSRNHDPILTPMQPILHRMKKEEKVKQVIKENNRDNHVLRHATAIHLSELARHLPFLTREDSLGFVSESVRFAKSDRVMVSTPCVKCSDWKCLRCTAVNNIDESCCFVCCAEHWASTEHDARAPGTIMSL